MDCVLLVFGSLDPEAPPDRQAALNKSILGLPESLCRVGDHGFSSYPPPIIPSSCPGEPRTALIIVLFDQSPGPCVMLQRPSPPHHHCSPDRASAASSREGRVSSTARVGSFLPIHPLAQATTTPADASDSWSLQLGSQSPRSVVLGETTDGRRCDPTPQRAVLRPIIPRDLHAPPAKSGRLTVTERARIRLVARRGHADGGRGKRKRQRLQHRTKVTRLQRTG